MWLEFAIAIAAGAVFLCAPGYLALRSASFARAAALACAPLVTLFVYPVLCIAFQAAGVFASWATLFVPTLALGAAVWAVPRARRALRARRGEADDAPSAALAFDVSDPSGRPLPWADGVLLALYVVVGIALGIWVFVSQLSAPDVIYQWFDNVHHLSQVRNYLDSGMWSPLDSYMYKSSGDEAVFDPYGGGAFYPSTWHCVAAMVAGFASTSVPVATNACVVLFACVVYPASAFFFLRTVFPGRAGVVAAGSLVALVCGVFPWGFAIAGPLYPNLVAMASLPALAGLFVAVFRHGERGRVRAACAVVFVVGLVASAFAHPNAAFSLAVVLIPYCASQMPRIERHLPGSRGPRGRVAVKAALVAAFLLAAATTWWAFYNAPALRSVVEFNWEAFKSTGWAIYDALFANYRETTPNFLIGALVVAGAVVALRRRVAPWVVGSYAFAVLIYVVAASTEGFAKALLAGFWYTDFYRLGATAIIAALPLAALGLATACAMAARAAGRIALSPRTPVLAGAVVAIVCAALWCVPWRPYVLPFVDGDADRAYTQIGRAQRYVADRYTYDAPCVYDAAERAFVQKVVDLIGTDELVINEPNDGTMFAYGTDGLNVMYRHMYGPGTIAPASTIRLRLDRIGRYMAVREAVKETGARYVIQLDQGGSDGDGYYMFSYDPTEWRGIDRIDDDTPGFEVVLAEGDRRLYRITVFDDENASDGAQG